MADRCGRRLGEGWDTSRRWLPAKSYHSRLSLETWLLFVMTEAVLSMTPGPAVLLVLSTGLRGGAARGIRASLGILSANALYFAISASSLGAVVMTSTGMYQAVKWLGAGYLLYLGAKDLIRPSGELGALTGPARNRRDYFNGLLLQIANPKAIVFFVALLPQFINPRAPVPMQVAIFGVSSICVEFLVLSTYSAIAGSGSHLVGRPAYARMTHRVGGAMLILAALGLAAMTR
jgi:homoserine/homoserine lactone efflux protein